MTFDQAKNATIAILHRPRYFVIEASRTSTEVAHVYKVRGAFVSHYNYQDKSWWPTRRAYRFEDIAKPVSEVLASEVIRHFQAIHDFHVNDTPSGKKANA